MRNLELMRISKFKLKVPTSQVRGFTLVEVMVALMLLTMGIIALSSSWSGSLFSFRKSQIVRDAVFLLKTKMSEVENKYTGDGFASIPEEEEGEFGEEYPAFKWKIESKEIEFPDMTSFMLSNSEEGVDQLQQTVIAQLTDQLKQNVKEVKLTVIYTKGKKPISYSLATMFVNFGANSLGALGFGAGATNPSGPNTNSDSLQPGLGNPAGGNP